MKLGFDRRVALKTPASTCFLEGREGGGGGEGEVVRFLVCAGRGTLIFF